MNSRSGAGLCAIATIAGTLYVARAWCEEPTSDVPRRPTYSQKATSDKSAEREPRISVAAARERAKLMHEIYETTLDVMHRHFFRSDRSVLPARAMEDVFVEMAKQSTAQARWISINTKAISIHHEPESDFEKQAAKAITAGKEEFELVEKRYYQLVGPIPLGSGCVGCHSQQFSSPSTSPSLKFAGLAIRISVNDE